MYAVVFNYNETNKVCNVAVVTPEPDLALAGVDMVGYDNLGVYCASHKLTPINFDIERDGSVNEYCSFDRFKGKSFAVVLGELVSKDTDKTMGYRLITPQGAIVNKHTEELINLHKSKGFVLQNGMFAADFIRCYKFHKFPRVIIGNKTKAKVSPVRHAPIKATSGNAMQVKPKLNFTPEQLKELERAKHKGITDSFLYNTALTPEQMRVLWVAKDKGALSEYFARPDYSVDVMKWYADRIVTPYSAKIRGYMLANPKLTTAHLDELDDCLANGVEFSDLCDDKLSLSSVQVKRAQRMEKLWSSGTEVDSNGIVNNAVNYMSKRLS